MTPKNKFALRNLFLAIPIATNAIPANAGAATSSIDLPVIEAASSLVRTPKIDDVYACGIETKLVAAGPQEGDLLTFVQVQILTGTREDGKILDGELRIRVVRVQEQAHGIEVIAVPSLRQAELKLDGEPLAVWNGAETRIGNDGFWTTTATPKAINRLSSRKESTAPRTLSFDDYSTSAGNESVSFSISLSASEWQALERCLQPIQENRAPHSALQFNN